MEGREIDKAGGGEGAKTNTRGMRATGQEGAKNDNTT